MPGIDRGLGQMTRLRPRGYLEKTGLALAISFLMVGLGLTVDADPTFLRSASEKTHAGPFAVTPQLQLTLTPNHLEAEVTNNQVGEVEFAGTAEVDQPRLMRSTVTLSETCVWNANATPQTMVFEGPDSKEFSVKVIVPPKTSSLEVGQVIVSGTCRSPGMPVAVAQANAVVTVAQYYKTSLGSDAPRIGVNRGDEVSCTINIYNEGNGISIYQVYVIEQPEDIEVSLSQSRVEVPAETFEQINLDISVGEDASYRINLITLRVVALEDGEPVDTDTYSISVHVEFPVEPFSGVMIAVVGVLAAVGIIVAIGIRKGKQKGFKSARRWMRRPNNRL
jgi:hypothetical protein